MESEEKMESEKHGILETDQKCNKTPAKLDKNQVIYDNQLASLGPMLKDIISGIVIQFYVILELDDTCLCLHQ